MPIDGGEANDCKVRVVSIYATSWHYKGSDSEDLGTKLELGALKPHYELYKDRLPRLLPFRLLSDPIRHDDIRFAEKVNGIRVTEVDALLFALPSNQVVLTVTLGFTTSGLTAPDEPGVKAVTKVLEQSIEGKMEIRRANPAGQGVAAYISLTDYVNQLKNQIPDVLDEDLTGEKWSGNGTDEAPDGKEPERCGELLPERHQLVFVARRGPDEAVPSRRVVNEIIYRDIPPYREEFARQKTPEQLNHLKLPAEEHSSNGQSWLRILRPGSAAQQDGTPTTLGVVTPYVSLLYAHRRDVEDSIFLSTVHAVGTASQFRQIWHRAYQEVRQFREKKQQQEVGLQTRADLEDLADNLGNLQFDLAFSVEFPLMRIETFQTALYEAMDLSTQAKDLGQMFDQLGGSLRSEITAIDAREKRRDERRQKWNAFAAGLLSLIGVSVGFVVAFLGINTTEVPDGTDDKKSMWDPHFANLYLVAGLFALIPAYLILVPYLRDWAMLRKNHRPLWWGLGLTATGGGLFAAASLVHHLGTINLVVLDAVLKAFAVLALAVGLTLVVMWLWKPVTDRLSRLFKALWRKARGKHSGNGASGGEPSGDRSPGDSAAADRRTTGPVSTPTVSTRAAP